MRSPRVSPAPALAGGLVTVGSLLAWQIVRDGRTGALPTPLLVLIGASVVVVVGALTWLRMLPLRPYMAVVSIAFTASAVVLAWRSGVTGTPVVPPWLAVLTAAFVLAGWPSYRTRGEFGGPLRRRDGDASDRSLQLTDPDDLPDDITVRELAALLIGAQRRAERAEARLDAYARGIDPDTATMLYDGGYAAPDPFAATAVQPSDDGDDGDDGYDDDAFDDDSTDHGDDDVVGGRWQPVDDRAPLGSGRCGDVIVVRDVHAPAGTPDLAAMKLLGATETSTSLQQRLLREVDLLRRIDSDWVTPLIDGGWDDDTGQAFLVLPLHSEGSLARLLAEYAPTPLPMGVALRYGFDCFAAIADLHECAPPIVHRDVKPANLLLTDDRVDVVLCDFGIARLIEVQTAGITVGVPPHTPLYAAPEQLDGVVEPCVDVYAGAAVCYEMLTGRPPFAREIEAARGARNWLDMVDDPRTRPEPLAARRPDTPAEVAAVLDACLSLDPHARPTAADVADVLAPYADDDALGTVPRVARTLYDD